MFRKDKLDRPTVKLGFALTFLTLNMFVDWVHQDLSMLRTIWKKRRKNIHKYRP